MTNDSFSISYVCLFQCKNYFGPALLKLNFVWRYTLWPRWNWRRFQEYIIGTHFRREFGKISPSYSITRITRLTQNLAFQLWFASLHGTLQGERCIWEQRSLSFFPSSAQRKNSPRSIQSELRFIWKALSPNSPCCIDVLGMSRACRANFSAPAVASFRISKISLFADEVPPVVLNFLVYWLGNQHKEQLFERAVVLPEYDFSILWNWEIALWWNGIFEI